MRFLIFALGSLLTMTSYSTQCALYIVTDIKVDEKAENGLKAREKALEKGSLKAFDALKAKVKEMYPTLSLSSLQPRNLSAHLRGFVIQEERTLPTRYIATLQYEFKPSIQSLFGEINLDLLADQPIQAEEVLKETVPSLESSSPPQIKETLAPLSSPSTSSQEPIFLIPIYRIGERTYLWQEENILKQFLLQNEKAYKGSKIIVPYGDGDDIAQIGLNQIIQGDENALKALAERYQASRNIWVLIVTFPKGDQGDTSQAEVIVRFLGDSPKPQRHFHLSDISSTAPEPLLETIFKRLQDVDQKIDKQELMKASAPLKDLPSWVSLRRKLNSIPGVSLKNMSFKVGLVQFHIDYQGMLQDFQKSLAQYGLMAIKQGDTLVISQSESRSAHLPASSPSSPLLY